MIKPMEVLLVGYGRMGKEVETVCAARGHRIVARVDPVAGDHQEVTADLADRADCAVEFSVADAVVANARRYGEFSLNAVVGTTGWYDDLETVEKIVRKRKTGYLYGSNFSIGARLFFRLVAEAVRMMNPFPEYDVAGLEVHHRRKKDSPSGTAREIARIILENSVRKTSVATDRLDRTIRENELHFASVRGGEFPGIHRVFFDSAADTVELSHTARNRSGFALGAVLAAEWLAAKRGLFTVDEFIGDLLAGVRNRAAAR
jgi:4-hydroxy-tetrahydrodipicolinate reductase